MPLAPGARLGPYEVVASLGSGGMGDVYKASDTRLGRFVALKTIRAGHSDAVDRDRFQREARAIAALAHPHIVTIHSIEEHDGVLFLTMELVEGRPLSTAIPSRGMTLSALLDIAIPLVDAVAAAHARGITHRDLKPDNVMVADGGRLKVLDFGLAKLSDRARAAEVTAATELQTSPGAIVGTAAYMSPEQAEGRPVDHRTDIFAVGIILYELATGQRPFTGDSSASVMASILRDTPASIDTLNPSMPPELARLVRRCLEKAPAEQLQSALDLKHELEDLRRGTVSSAAAPATRTTSPDVPASLPPQREGRGFRALVGAAVLIALAGAAYLWTRGAASDAAPAAAADPSTPITVARFENRTGDATLDPVGQLAADALSQELPNLVEFVRQTDLGSGAVPLQASASRQLDRRGAVSGAYYVDGPNLRVQATLMDDAGQVLHAIEPVVGPRTNPGALVDQLRERVLGVIVVWLDPTVRLVPTLTRPPIYSAYREYRTGFGVFADDPARAVVHGTRAIELDPTFFDAYYLVAQSYNNLFDRTRAGAALERMDALRARWTPKERELLDYLREAAAGRLPQALAKLQKAQQLDPDDLVTNYLVGFYLLRLNRPQQCLDESAKLDAASWDTVTIGSWRYARLTGANHLLGRHDEELRVARVARGLFPAAMPTRLDELVALGGLGRIDDIQRALDDLATVPANDGMTAGQLMRAASDELRAHGHRDDAIAVARRAATWYRNRPAQVLDTPANRFALAQSLYATEAWAEAYAIAAALLKEQKTNAAYATLVGASAARRGDTAAARAQAAALAALPSEPTGLVELRRAQLAALLGERERALELLRDAFSRGLSMSPALHRQIDLESLRGYAPFDELMKPKG